MNLQKSIYISTGKGFQTGGAYYIDTDNTVLSKDKVSFVDVYTPDKKWIGMAPRRAFAVLKTENQAKEILRDLKGMYPGMETLYEDTIINAVTQDGLYALRQYHLIETCATFNGRKLYAI